MISSRVRPEHLRDDGGRGDLHQHDVVEADLLKLFSSAMHALDLVRLDHRGEHVAHRERRACPPPRRCARASRPSARMPPRLSDGWPHSAASQVSLKSSQRIIAPMLKAACTGSSWNDVPGTFAPLGTTVPGTIGPSSLVQAGYVERLEAAAQRVDQAVARGVVGASLRDLVLRDVVGDVDQDLVGLGADVGDGCGHEGIRLRYSW